MSLCRLMVYDYMYGRKTFNPDMYRNAQLYDRHDLSMGLAYAEGYITDGLTAEPFYGFKLEDFAQWCRNKLCQHPHSGKKKAGTQDK